MSKKLLMNVNDASLVDRWSKFDKEFTGSFITASDSSTQFIDTDTIVESKYMREITEIWGNTTQDENDLSNIQSLGWWNENKKAWEVDILSSNELGEFLKWTQGEDGFYYYFKYSNPFFIKTNDKTDCVIKYQISSDGIKYSSGWDFTVKEGSYKFIHNGSDKYVRFKVESPILSYRGYDNANIKEYSEIIQNKTTISLPCQLQKVGDIVDRLYWDETKCRYVIENLTTKFTLNGSNAVAISNFNVVDSDFITFQINIPPSVNYGGAYAQEKTTISNITPYTTWSQLTGKNFEWYSLSGDNKLHIRLAKTRNLLDVDSFKNYINNTPIDVYYKLQTPELIETNITQKLRLPTYEGTTHTFIIDGVTDASNLIYEDKSVDILVGATPIEIFGNTVQDSTDLSKIESLGTWNERLQGYEVEVSSAFGFNLANKINPLFQTVVDGNVEKISEGYKFINTHTRGTNIRFYMDCDTSKEYTVQLDITTNTMTSSVMKFLKHTAHNPIVTIQNGETKRIKFKLSPFANDILFYLNINPRIIDEFIEIENIIILEGDYMDLIYDIEDVKQNKTTILLPCQLQKVGDIADRLYWDSVKGRYVVEKNVPLHDLFKELGEPYNIGQYSATDGNSYIGFEFKKPIDVKNSNGVVFATGLKGNSTIWGNSSGEGIRIWNDSIMFRLLDGKLNDANHNTIKNYLKNIDVYSQSETPQLIETNITEKIKVPTYPNKTHIYVTSNNIDASNIKALVPYKELK